jgi:hypothetical protein
MDDFIAGKAQWSSKPLVMDEIFRGSVHVSRLHGALARVRVEAAFARERRGDGVRAHDSVRDGGSCGGLPGTVGEVRDRGCDWSVSYRVGYGTTRSLTVSDRYGSTFGLLLELGLAVGVRGPRCLAKLRNLAPQWLSLLFSTLDNLHSPWTGAGTQALCTSDGTSRARMGPPSETVTRSRHGPTPC